MHMLLHPAAGHLRERQRVLTMLPFPGVMRSGLEPVHLKHCYACYCGQPCARWACCRCLGEGVFLGANLAVSFEQDLLGCAVWLCSQLLAGSLDHARRLGSRRVTRVWRCFYLSSMQVQASAGRRAWDGLSVQPGQLAPHIFMPAFDLYSMLLCVLALCQQSVATGVADSFGELVVSGTDFCRCQ